jgi:L-rhamnose mutarotase
MRVAFKMKLFPGQAEEYKRRHSEIWPDLKALLKTAGIEDYSIFLDETTNDLVGVLKVGDTQKQKELAHHAVMKKWWAYMKDIMDTNPDNSPVAVPLKEVFYME